MACEVSEEIVSVADTLRTLQKHLQCGICLEIFRNPSTTRCGHTFCRRCVDCLFTSRNTVCPLCSTALKRRGIVPNDQLERFAKAVAELISASQKDVAVLGVEDILQVERKHVTSTREAFSPSRVRQLDASIPEAVVKTSSKVESWLSELHPPSLTQESSPSVHVDTSPYEDSDGEMISVSQINESSKVDTHLRSKNLSGHIEEDKNSCSKAVSSTVVPKQVGQLRTKPKQDIAKNILGQANLSTQSGLNASKGELCEVSVPEPTVVVLGPEKENATKVLPARSPGWSRVQKMKKDFHNPSGLNAKKIHSQVPIIEDAGSADEEPCVSLALDSPVLKRKAKVHEIVNNLESEIQILEKCNFLRPQETKKSRVNIPPKCNDTTVKPSNPPPQAKAFLRPGTGIQFLKLGSLTPKKSPQVPFYLKGCLQHMPHDIIATNSFRLLLDAETQTYPFTPMDASSSSSDKQSNEVQNIPPELSPTQNVKSPSNRRSGGMFSDIMDAETVLYSQVPKENGDVIQRADSYLSPVNQGPTIEDILLPDLRPTLGDALFENDVQSQQTESLIFSQNVVKSPQKTPVLETDNNIVTIDSDDSSASGIEERRAKRGRACLSDSSDSDVVVSKRPSKKKGKSRVLSDNEDSRHAEPLPEMSLLDASLPDPEIQAKLKADIEADLNVAERMQNTNWHHAHSKSNTTVIVDVQDSALYGGVVSDGDSDSEVINPTPQKQQPKPKPVIFRNSTQSDDIVPSSQPVIETHRGTLRRALPVTESSEVGATEIISQESSSQETGIGIEDELFGQRKDESSSKRATSPLSSRESESTPVILNPPPTAKPSFVCTNLSPTMAAQVEKLANIVGGEFSSKFTVNTTHLVVRVDEENRADKTLKYLSSIAAGKWVVSFQWVQKCLEAKKLLPEEPFEALDTSGEPGPRRSREAHKVGKKLFRDFEFCCIGDYPDLSIEQLKALLIDCGASVVSQPSDLAFRDHIVPVSLAQWDDAKEQEYSSWLERYNSPLVQHEWVLECIGKFCVASFYNMLLSEAPDEVYLKMGIPAYLLEPSETEEHV